MPKRDVAAIPWGRLETFLDERQEDREVIEVREDIETGAQVLRLEPPYTARRFLRRHTIDMVARSNEIALVYPLVNTVDLKALLHVLQAFDATLGTKLARVVITRIADERVFEGKFLAGLRDAAGVQVRILTGQPIATVFCLGAKDEERHLLIGAIGNHQGEFSPLTVMHGDLGENLAPMQAVFEEIWRKAITWREAKEQRRAAEQEAARQAALEVPETVPPPEDGGQRNGNFGIE